MKTGANQQYRRIHKSRKNADHFNLTSSKIQPDRVSKKIGRIYEHGLMKNGFNAISGAWYHESCEEVNGVIGDSDFFCFECIE